MARWAKPATKDLAGRPVDATRHLPRRHQRHRHRRAAQLHPRPSPGQVHGQSGRKLLSYALNRSLQLSDESLVDQMKTSLAADGYRFRALVETIVTARSSRQAAESERSVAPTKPVAVQLIKASSRRRT